MSPKKIPIEVSMRAEIAAHLPAAFSTAMESYNTLSAQKLPTDDVKAMTSHHAACKAVIAHLQLLIKLAQWVEGDASEADAALLAERIAEAEEELSRSKELGEEE